MQLYSYMDHLGQFLRKATAHKKISTTAYVGIAVYHIEKFLDTSIDVSYVRHSVLYVRIADHGKKILLHQKKHDILATIHDVLKKN